ncbi:MAG: hypothetical protein OXI03_03125, partial [Chloroflexota bacterium]|nr:hypothetical protein [Chloroflexota bacterium]
MPAARYHVGGLTIRVLSDGCSWQDAGAVHGLVPRVMWERVTTDLNAQHQIPLALNCLLLESDGKTVLIETGQGVEQLAVPHRAAPRPQQVAVLVALARLDQHGSPLRLPP